MYNNKQFTTPIWQGDTVFWESFMPVKDRVIPLLYPAVEILSVKNATGEKEYEYGKDYLLSDGKIILPETSAITVMPWEVYNPKESDKPDFCCADGSFLFFSEQMTFHNNYQYLVTYRHNGTWDGYVPNRNPAKLQQTRALLANKTPFVLGFFGDSITEGYNSSGKANIHVPPYIPEWPKMVWERLKYGHDGITFINRAVAGKATNWGIETVEEAFRDTPPDLLVLAFGMNDATGNMDRLVFRDNIKTICDRVLALNPDCEILLVSTTLPNELAVRFNKDQGSHEELLAALADEYGDRADLVRMTSIHRYLLTKKRYYDMTGNNINHPNDFLARVYAQAVLAIL